MKVALVCPTVGQTRRGYERFMTELFALVRDEFDATLFKGAGEALPGEVVVPHMKRTGVVARLAGSRLRYARYRLEFATFAAALLPHLRRGDFDVVHAIDPPLARPLSAMRRLARRPYGLLFTDGGPAPFDASPFADLVHYLTPAAHAAGLARGEPQARMAMIPVGVHPSSYALDADRAALRREYGVDPATFVVLAVTTLNRHHKRVDFLIEEVAKLPGDVLLWIDASLHPDGDASLLALARERLGGRFRHTHVGSGEVARLYRLADVMASASLDETFGMALAEAMCAGLPVVAHDAPHFRWLVAGMGHLANLQAPGSLAGCLARLASDRGELRRVADAGRAIGRFGWAARKADYLDLYRRARHTGACPRAVS